MALNLNPVLSEIQGLSPAAQAALGMAGHTLPDMGAPSMPSVTQAPSHMAPGLITPQMKADALVPKDNAGPAPTMSPMHMDAPAPVLSAPSEPNVSGPILGTTQGDSLNRQSILQKGPGVDNIYKNITGSDFGQNHPVLGKILGAVGEVGGKIGDTLSNALPGIGREIPGTTQNYNRELGRANTALTQDEANGEKQAQTAHTSEETAEMPGKSASEEGLQGAQTAHLNEETKEMPGTNQAQIEKDNAETEKLLHPDAKNDFDAWYKQNPGHPIAEWLQLQSQSKPAEHVGGMMPNGQTLMGDFKNGKYLNPTTGEELVGFKPVPPPTPAGSIVLNPSTAGGYDAQAVKPGTHINPGAVTVGGMNTLDTPTSQTRNMAEMAKTVLPQMTAISNEVDKMAASIGPAAGRWNDLMVNKGGSDFPAFAKLDTDLDLLASAIVRTHFGARGGQQYREELRKQFGEAQSPEDLKARIMGANSWLQGYAHMADPAGQGGAAPKENDTKVNSAGDPLIYQGGQWKLNTGAKK